MKQHISIVAALQIGFSLLYLVLGIFIFLLLAGIGFAVADETALLVLGAVGTLLATLFVAISVPGILAGIGLFYRQNWARFVVIIISVFDLFSFPFGTILGVYSIWVMTHEESVAFLTGQQIEESQSQQSAYVEPSETQTV